MEKEKLVRVCDWCGQEEEHAQKPERFGGQPPFRQWYQLRFVERIEMPSYYVNEEKDFCCLKCLQLFVSSEYTKSRALEMENG